MHLTLFNPIQALLPEASNTPALKLPRTFSQITGSATEITTVALFAHDFT